MTPLLLTLALQTPAHPPRPMFYPPPVVVPAPVLPGVPYPAPAARPMTIQEFARCFVPTPGPHVVCLIHPTTCKPVTVAFTLPDGCGCPKVKASKREVEFDYGRREVELQFKHRGTVDVRTR